MILVHINVIFFLLSITLTFHTTNSASFNEPHSHNGKVTPYPPGDPKVKLDSKAIGILDIGKPYQTQITQGGGGRALCVQDINAPPSTVWDRILDLDNYSTMVAPVTHSANYHVDTNGPGGSSVIFTRMTLGLPLLKIEYFVRHLHYPKKNSLVWTLDYDKKSDLDDSVGYWYVVDHPDKEGWSRVYYSVELVIFDWVPTMVKNMLMSKALTDATAWVKKESEERAAADRGIGDVDTPKKKKKGPVKRFFTKIFRLDRKKKCEESDETCANEDSAMLASKEPVQEVGQPAGLTRAVLVTFVSILVIYNLGLFLERMSR